jgi:hypothetical protein
MRLGHAQDQAAPFFFISEIQIEETRLQSARKESVPIQNSASERKPFL